MDVSKEGIKTWLARFPDRDRNWLADKCEVEKRTVDNWLSSPRAIPSKALLIIESLMRKDAEAEPVATEDFVKMPVTCTPSQLDLYTRAFKVSECKAFSGWITSRLDAAAQAEIEENESVSAPTPGNSPHLLPNPQQSETA